jgi:uncharacterized protein YkwD
MSRFVIPDPYHARSSNAAGRMEKSPVRYSAARLPSEMNHNLVKAVAIMARTQLSSRISMHAFVRQAVILCILSALLTGEGAASYAQPLRAVDIEAEEQQTEVLIAQAINAERARLAPAAKRFADDAALQRMAHERSYAMAHGAPFAHEDESGRFVAADMVKKQFGPYGAIGENIMMERDAARAFDPEAFARRAVRGWMNSEGHRANILSGQYERAGVGVSISGSYAYATQLFWGPPRRTRNGGERRRP